MTSRYFFIININVIKRMKTKATSPSPAKSTATHKPRRRQSAAHRAILTMTEEDKQRFAIFCDIAPGDECWLWNNLKKHGYGRFVIKGVDTLAHRVAYFIVRGKLPPKMMIRHRDCHVRLCVRPSHLFRGTHSQNIEDSKRAGRSLSGELSSSRLHPECLPRGEKHHWHKHSDAKLLKLTKDYYRFKIPVQDLALKYSMSEQNVRALLGQKTRKYLPVPGRAALLKARRVRAQAMYAAKRKIADAGIPRLIRLRDHGATLASLAKQFRVSIGAIRNALKRGTVTLGLHTMRTVGRRKKFTLAQWNRVLPRLLAGDINAAARALKVTATQVRAVLGGKSRKGLANLDKPALAALRKAAQERGNVKRRKFSDSEAMELLKQNESESSVVGLARAHDVSETAIRNAITRARLLRSRAEQAGG